MTNQHWHSGHDQDTVICHSTAAAAIHDIQYWLTQLIRNGHGGDESQRVALWDLTGRTFNRADFRRQVEEQGEYSVCCPTIGRDHNLWIKAAPGSKENCEDAEAVATR